MFTTLNGTSFKMLVDVMTKIAKELISKEIKIGPRIQVEE